MTHHIYPSNDIQAGDTVNVPWSSYGMIRAKVVAVLPDGGLRLVRWNKSRDEWTTNAHRYHKTASGRGWYEDGASDYSMFDSGRVVLRYEVVNTAKGAEVVNVVRVGGVDSGKIIRTITGAEAAGIISKYAAKQVPA